MSKLNMLMSLDACDPMPQLRWEAVRGSDPRLQVTQLQECAAGDAKMEVQHARKRFETINYTPDLDKITGKKLPGLPAAPKRRTFISDSRPSYSMQDCLEEMRKNALASSLNAASGASLISSRTVQPSTNADIIGGRRPANSQEAVLHAILDAAEKLSW